MKNTTVWCAALGLVLGFASTQGCADVDEAGNAVEGAAQALTTVLDLDFSDHAVGPLGSPWTVRLSGSGTADIVDTADHGRALRFKHGAERDFAQAALPLNNSSSLLEFEFQLKPKSSASTFTLGLSGPKSGYSTARFSVSMVPNSTTLTVSSVGANGGCGAVPYGKWSTVRFTEREASAGSTRRVVDVRVNGVLLATCTGVSTTMRVANNLFISDNTQPSANAETMFDDFFAQATP